MKNKIKIIFIPCFMLVALMLVSCNTKSDKLQSKYHGTYKNISYNSEIDVSADGADVKQLLLVNYECDGIIYDEYCIKTDGRVHFDYYSNKTFSMNSDYIDLYNGGTKNIILKGFFQDKVNKSIVIEYELIKC